MAQLEHARALERTYDRRAARAKRSRWLGRMICSLIGVGLLLVLRLNPAMVIDALAFVQGTQNQSTRAAPRDTHVRQMPSDSVPVRRGGSLPGNGHRTPQNQTQSQVDAVADTLRGLDPDG